jgi:hypothetical protein
MTSAVSLVVGTVAGTEDWLSCKYDFSNNASGWTTRAICSN